MKRSPFLFILAVLLVCGAASAQAGDGETPAKESICDDLPNATPGQYTLRATLGDTVSERTVTVGDYELPAFRVMLQTDRAYYAPGERVTGSVQAEYFFGKPVAGGKVILRGYTKDPRGAPEIVIQAQTDDEGTAKFAFYLPPDFGQSATMEPFFFDLEADVLDAAGQRAGIRQFLPVSLAS